MESIRVLTWNLWWRFGDWRRRLEAISSVLDKVQPDICCFQEVWSSATEDVADQLGRSHGLDHVARSYSDEPERWQRQTGDADIDYGNAIVSRWPLLETEVRRLPGPHGRTSLSAVVDTPAGAVPMLCTHLSAHPAASAERCDQVRAVVEHVAAVGARDFPPVVAGDFNAEPDSDEIRLLSGTKTAPVVPDLYLVDAWRFRRRRRSRLDLAAGQPAHPCGVRHQRAHRLSARGATHAGAGFGSPRRRGRRRSGRRHLAVRPRRRRRRSLRLRCN